PPLRGSPAHTAGRACVRSMQRSTSRAPRRSWRAAVSGRRTAAAADRAESCFFFWAAYCLSVCGCERGLCIFLRCVSFASVWRPVIRRTRAGASRGARHVVARDGERVEIFPGAFQLQCCVVRLHHGAPQSVSGGLLRWTRLRIPVDVLARDPDSSLLPVESVQIAQMSEHDITDFFDGRFLGHGAVAQERGDLTKNPRSALCAAADHQSICAGFFKYVLRFVRRVDVAIGKNGNRDGFLDG